MFAFYPDPDSVGSVDAPPADLIAMFLPELADRHGQLVAALKAANDAGAALDRIRPSRAGLSATAGTEWSDARRDDADTARAGKTPGALATVIAAFPVRYAAAAAAATVAAGAVRDWNTTARTAVTADTRDRVEAAVDAALADAITAAARARVDADSAHPTDPNQRLDAAWSALSDMDQALTRWRPAHQILAWTNGHRWDPPWPGMRPDVEVIARATALRDDTLRREFSRRDAVPKVPQVS
jgi:hypothetical protein